MVSMASGGMVTFTLSRITRGPLTPDTVLYAVNK